MKQYVSIINEIKSNNGRIAKENLLKKYEDVEGLKEIFKFVYNPMITTGLAKRKIEKKFNDVHSVRSFSSIFDLMEHVKTYNTGTDGIIRSVKSFLNTLETQEEKDLAQSILIKDLPIGLSRTTLNKVYGADFIPKYSVMLAGKYDEAKSKFKNGFAISLKLDGNRITAFNYEDGVKFFTRSGKEVEGLEDLTKQFDNLPKDMVYDGEIIAENTQDLASKDLFNMTQTIVRRKGKKIGLDFIMFDMLPINEFNEGKSQKTYIERLTDMKSMLKSFSIPNIRLVPIYYTGDDIDEIPKILKQVEEMELEGLMINDLDGYYETKRSKSILKVKTFHTADLLCVGVKEDIRGGKCGSLTVDYKGHRVDVSGLKDKDKVGFWNNPELVVGKMIEVKYFEESKNAQGGISLRFPNFLRIREDKTVEDVSYA